jgi:hypothetical protein
VAILSASRGETSFGDRDGKIGLFTKALIEGLEGEAAEEGGEVTLASLSDYVIRSVERSSQQLHGTSQQPLLVAGDQPRFVLSPGIASRKPQRLEQVIDQLAASIAEPLLPAGKVGEIKLQLGPQYSAAAEDRLNADLIAALEKHEIKIDRSSRRVIRGSLRIDRPSQDAKLGVPIAFDLRLEDEVGQFHSLPKVNFAVSPRDALVLAGLPANLPAPISAEATQQQVARLLEGDEAGVAVEGSLVKAGSRAKFALELLAYRPSDSQPKYRALRPNVEDDRAYLDIEEGEAYAIRVHNEEAFDIAVDLRVNGYQLTRFAEKESVRNQPWIVAAKSQVVLKGWYRSPTETAALVVNSMSDSALALATRDRPGSIYASYRAAWKVGEVPPDEPREAGITATGHGPGIDTSTSEIRRQFGEVRGAIGIELNR